MQMDKFLYIHHLRSFTREYSLFVIGYNQMDEFVGWNDQTTFMYTNVNM